MLEAGIALVLLLMLFILQKCAAYLKRIADRIDPPETVYIDDADKKVWM